MSAPATDRITNGPVPPFGSDPHLTRAPAPIRSATDREDVPKERRVPPNPGAHVTELEPHWLETIDSATD
jgi:hypothetical protein